MQRGTAVAAQEGKRQGAPPTEQQASEFVLQEERAAAVRQKVLEGAMPVYKLIQASQLAS